MRELDFDLFLQNDAGRTFYRGFVIYAGLYAFKHHNSSSVKARLVNNIIENQFWKPSNCVIQMKPRLRLFYSAMIISFVPYISRMLLQHFGE